MNYLNDERIQHFIEHVNKQLYTETEANDISNELLDHIECLVKDYLESGFSENEAIVKALKQMGDPKEIGYSFTDFEGLKHRKRIMFFFKLSSIAFFIFTMFMITKDTSFSGGEFDPLEASTGILNLINLSFLVMSGVLSFGSSSKLFKLNSSPEIILWPYKQKFKWEYALLGFFFIPLVILFLWIYFIESGLSTRTFLSLWPILTFAYAIWAFFYSEKFRIPKYMVIEEGLLIKNKFVSWAAIASYQWQKDFYAKDDDHYTLVLKTFQVNNGAEIRKKISIHERQKIQLSQLLIERT